MTQFGDRQLKLNYFSFYFLERGFSNVGDFSEIEYHIFGYHILIIQRILNKGQRRKHFVLHNILN